jgi:phenol/toluene 2-monooxygenase (NADH) P5/A5
MAKEKEIYHARLSKIDEMTPTVRNFHFEFPEKPRFDYKPGQFVMVEVPRDGKTVRKPYSIASPPHWPNKVELCIKQVEGGYVSTYFFNLQVGYVMPMEGPLGVFALKEPLPEHLLFVATGTGVAPLRAQIHTLLHLGYQKKITLLLGVRHEYEILFDEEFKALAKAHTNFEYIPTISRPQQWSGAKGYVQEQIKTRFPNPQGIQIYACGLVPMINALKDELTTLGYPKDALHFERWT